MHSLGTLNLSFSCCNRHKSSLGQGHKWARNSLFVVERGKNIEFLHVVLKRAQKFISRCKDGHKIHSIHSLLFKLARISVFCCSNGQDTSFQELSFGQERGNSWAILIFNAHCLNRKKSSLGARNIHFASFTWVWKFVLWPVYTLFLLNIDNSSLVVSSDWLMVLCTGAPRPVL